MENLVVDCNVVIKWYVPEVHTQEVQAILDAYVDGKVQLLAPDLIHAELANVLWKKNKTEGLELKKAKRILRSFEELEFVFTPTRDLFHEALAIAHQCQRSVYDSLYVALTQREQCAFVTADERLVNAIQSVTNAQTFTATDNQPLPKIIHLPNWSAQEDD
jgi:predicted nucleic acid-binding protein